MRNSQVTTWKGAPLTERAAAALGMTPGALTWTVYYLGLVALEIVTKVGS